MIWPGSRLPSLRAVSSLLLLTLLVSSASPSAFGQDTLWTQSSLLDVPNGPKQSLQDVGIDLDVNYTAFLQGLVAGQGDKDWEFGGKTDVIATLSGEKLGLWRGLYVNAHAEFVNGDNVLTQGDGSILPVNTALAFPTLGGHDSDLSLIVTQVFSERTSLSVGKFNMLDAAAKTPLIGGGGLTTFMNTGLAAPISGVTPPYIIGGILTHKTDPATFTLMVYDPRNAQDSETLKHPFKDGVTTSLSITVPVEIAGRRGYQGVRGVYSTHQWHQFQRYSRPHPAARQPGHRHHRWILVRVHTRSNNISSKTNRTLPGLGPVRSIRDLGWKSQSLRLERIHRPWGLEPVSRST